MNKKILSKDQPLIPYLEIDGGYARCTNCWNEVTPKDNICPKCNQIQDWSWFKKETKND